MNFQGDAISVHVNQSDMTAGQVIDLMLRLGRANLAEMQDEARRIVDERLEDFANKFVSTLGDRNSDAVSAVSDPDVQYALLTAQRDFARSGEEQLGDTLVDLLVARCSEQTGSLRALALNAAIDTVGRLTSAQLDALTSYWTVVRLRSLAIGSIADLATWLRQHVLPFCGSLPAHDAAYEHLVYAGCATLQISERKFGYVFRETYPGLFARGFTLEEMPERLRGIQGITTPCLNDSAKLQVRALSTDIAEERAEEVGRPDIASDLKELLKAKMYSDSEIEQMIVRTVPELRYAVERWNSTAIKNLQLTTVGTALAHANWTRVVGAAGSPLSIWIPEES